MISFRAKCVLLDIEGTTSSIAFVYRVMFQYVRDHLEAFLDENFEVPEVQSAIRQMATDHSAFPWEEFSTDANHHQKVTHVAQWVRRLMDNDVKTTGLKSLQGLIWRGGFEDGTLKSHLFPEVAECLKKWRALGLSLRIYSSGSVEAQRLFFSHTEQGNLLPLFDAQYDTKTGPKREAESYLRIAKEAQIPSKSILFISDVAEELEAAMESGMQVVASCRPGNAPLPDRYQDQRVHSFEEIELIVE